MPTPPAPLLREPRAASALVDLRPRRFRRPPLLVPLTWRQVHDGPCPSHARYWQHWKCLRPRHVPESGKLAPDVSSSSASTTSSTASTPSTTASTASPPTSSMRTRFWQNRSMPSSPTCAWFWQNYGSTSSSTVRTASTPASIDTFDLPRRVSVILFAHYALAASCAATSTPATPTTTSTTTFPRTATPTMAHRPALSATSTSAQRSTTSPETSPASTTVQASASRRRQRRSRYDCGGVSAYWV